MTITPVVFAVFAALILFPPKLAPVPLEPTSVRGDGAALSLQAMAEPIVKAVMTPNARERPELESKLMVQPILKRRAKPINQVGNSTTHSGPPHGSSSVVPTSMWCAAIGAGEGCTASYCFFPPFWAIPCMTHGLRLVDWGPPGQHDYTCSVLPNILTVEGC